MIMKRLWKIFQAILVATGLACCICAQAEPKRGMVVIKRDEYGVPHIYASDTYRLFYGYGYALAEDRLFQMEMAKRSTQGTVSQVLGKKFVIYDQEVRRNYWPASIHQQISALPSAEKDILQGYADGINAQIKHIARHPRDLMPRQFNDLGFTPQAWSAFDVAMVFVGTMANRFSDANSEIDNLALLTALGDRYGEKRAMGLFNQLKWWVHPDARTTIAQSDGAYSVAPKGKLAPMVYRLPRFDSPPPMLERLARGGDGRLLALTADANRQEIARQYLRSGSNGLAGFPTTSNIWLIGKKKARDAQALLLNGPQFGWFNPAYTYGIGLHGAGFNVVGNTPFAYPAILFGHNDKIAWGATAGFGDNVDIFAETVDPQRPDYYRHNGQWLKMLSRTDTIDIKDSLPQQLKVYRTLHGNVIKYDPATHIAYSKARAWEGQEVASLMAWVFQMQASNWRQWQQQAARQALTINWYYADVQGNIGYAHTGAYPRRRAGHDPRLPVPGSGEWDWQGILPFKNNPQIYNPPSNYIVNWNNSPQQGYPATDLFAFLWGRADRVDEIDQRIAARPTLDRHDAWQILQETSRSDLNVRLFLPFIVQATQGLPATDPRRQLAQILKKWNGKNQLSADGRSYTQPGSAIMDAWLTSMLDRTLGAVVPAPFDLWYRASGYKTTQDGPTGSLNISTGSKILYEALQGPPSAPVQEIDLFQGQPPEAVVRAALQQAYQQLTERYGTSVADWKSPAMHLTFRANNFLGIPQAGSKEALHQAEYQNRGTANTLIVLSPSLAPGKIRAFDVVAPGQSGFIAPDGVRSVHYQDQLGLYQNFSYKALWLDRINVQAHSRSQQKLSVER
jgi:penicillin amidase